MGTRPLPRIVPRAGPLEGHVLQRLRSRPTSGISRRALLRRSLGAAVGLTIVEGLGGTVGFLWSASTAASRRVRIGTLDELIALNAGLPIEDGFPAYVPDARAFILTIDPARGWQPGADPTGEGTALNVRALSQRCPHLGCRPNPCVEDFWFHCPCHQSRYDRLGIKAAGLGPAARGMDRLAVEVDRNGVLTVETGRISLGPLPVALGQPGLIPPRVERGCGG
ncbi:MAG TPA: Rieske 2Fe-2S domain-containing protein [Candidatus Limnocylindrales bacterium]|nr:Rieske 2Fe-2S domain-containing protein [Candidatus Limnocylindrales bacterium]